LGGLLKGLSGKSLAQQEKRPKKRVIAAKDSRDEKPESRNLLTDLRGDLGALSLMS